ncbi:hypothetical protein BHQ29_09120 [Pseudomonas sp. LPH1]|nr:hypothetical protein BHQ29_09120 [Pseudomonas sp. LPH1]
MTNLSHLILRTDRSCDLGSQPAKMADNLTPILIKLLVVVYPLRRPLEVCRNRFAKLIVCIRAISVEIIPMTRKYMRDMLEQSESQYIKNLIPLRTQKTHYSHVLFRLLARASILSKNSRALEVVSTVLP